MQPSVEADAGVEGESGVEVAVEAAVEVEPQMEVYLHVHLHSIEADETSNHTMVQEGRDKR